MQAQRKVAVVFARKPKNDADDDDNAWHAEQCIKPASQIRIHFYRAARKIDQNRYG